MSRETVTGFAMQNRFIDRRLGDRRLGGIANTGTAMSNGPARQSLGEAGKRDRRQWNYGLFCKAATPAEAFRAWLENHAGGKWDLRAGGGDGSIPSALNIMFEQESDIVSFVSEFSD
jgi:hypothetical protein